MFNAERYGYRFEVVRGLIFEKQVIFSDFINTLYEIKKSVAKSDPMYLISKLLQNSNYGRWALNYDLPSHFIVNDKLFDEMNRNTNLILSDPLELSPNRKLVGVTDLCKNENLDIDDSDFHFNVSIPISAAITAYARIFMSQFKNRDDIKLLYTDTDSIFIEGKLPSHLIGPGLGQFKLEMELKKCIILSPKVYGGILQDGSEIIKVKGLKKESINEYLTVDILESLLYKDSNIQIPNKKMIRDFEDRTIKIRKDLYTLMTTDNKSHLIYENDKFTKTAPLIIDSNKNIINKTP
jgi:hypothetical protein